jgi:hypothetical protein
MSKGLKDSLLPAAQAGGFFNTVTVTVPPAVPNTSSSWTMSGTGTYFSGTSTGKPEYNKEYEVEQVVKKHSKGYYYVISVSDTDDVFYQVFHAGKIAYWVHKITGKVHLSGLPIGEPVATTWSSVRKRTHLPATVGATYLEIDKEIEEYKKTLEHDDYAKGILETEPDNLKMIEGLEKLHEGDPDHPMNGNSPTYAFGSDPNAGFSSSNVISASDSFYMTVAEAYDVNVGGTLKVDGLTFEDKIQKAITKSLAERQAELVADMK